MANRSFYSIIFILHINLQLFTISGRVHCFLFFFVLLGLHFKETDSPPTFTQHNCNFTLSTDSQLSAHHVFEWPQRIRLQQTSRLLWLNKINSSNYGNKKSQTLNPQSNFFILHNTRNKLSCLPLQGKHKRGRQRFCWETAEKQPFYSRALARAERTRCPE